MAISVTLMFLSWFEGNYESEHESSYPKFIQDVISFFKEYKHLPKITIKIQASQKYKDDIFQLIQVGLTNGKLRSKEELEIEIKRQIPVFLELINQKRKNRNEPKVSEHQIIASAYLEMKDNEEMEISYACEVYLPVVKRILEESREEIKRVIKSTN